jgi:hypothetical protein
MNTTAPTTKPRGNQRSERRKLSSGDLTLSYSPAPRILKNVSYLRCGFPFLLLWCTSQQMARPPHLKKLFLKNGILFVMQKNKN